MIGRHQLTGRAHAPSPRSGRRVQRANLLLESANAFNIGSHTFARDAAAQGRRHPAKATAKI